MSSYGKADWSARARQAADRAAVEWTMAVLTGAPAPLVRSLRSALDGAVHHARKARLAALAGQDGAVVAAHAQAAESAARAPRRVVAAAGPPHPCPVTA